jgi:hypothetical protein
MKTMSVVGVLLCSLLFGIHDVSATLFNLSNTKGDVVYDTISQDLWIQNLLTFNALSYEAKIARINDLNRSSYFGISSWHLAPATNMQLLWMNPAQEFLKFQHNYVFSCTRYFQGIYDDQPIPGGGRHYTATVKYPCQPPSDVEKFPLATDSASDQFAIGSAPRFASAWVCADPPIPVPEPNSMLILGTGLFVLVVYSKRVRNTIN